MVDLKALANECGVEFYDDEIVSENSRTIYRVYITKDGGVKLDDCENFSRILSPILDVESPVSGEFFLEVSSPGLERKLVKAEHFSKSIGELAKISLNNGEKFSGKILSFDGENLALDGDVVIKFSDIKKARTYIEW